jgi:hypothetical protein
MGAISIRPTRRRSALLGALMTAGLVFAPLSVLAQQPGASQPSTPGQPAPSQQPAPGQPPAPSTQPQQQQQQQPGLTFDKDAGLLLMQVKPDKTSDFEAVMGKLHEALTKTDKPERKQQATGWKIYKSTDPGPQGNVLYVAIIEPPLKGADYAVAKILYEVFPTEVQAIFPVYRDALAAGLNKVNLELVQHFGQPAKPAPPMPAASTTGAAPTTAAPGGAESGATGTTGSTPSTPQSPAPTPR